MHQQNKHCPLLYPEAFLTSLRFALQFMCLGNSLYEPPTQQGSSGSSSGGQMQTLPYCEGLEVRARLDHAPHVCMVVLPSVQDVEFNHLFPFRTHCVTVPYSGGCSVGTQEAQGSLQLHGERCIVVWLQRFKMKDTRNGRTSHCHCSHCHCNGCIC